MNQPKFAEDCITGNDCLLQVAISGTKEVILNRLKEMVKQMEDSYGKPYQGIVSQYGGVSHVITPIWNGREH